jgi:hypothetical protein
MYTSSGIWWPSAHSIMKTLGYYYGQVGREVMTQRISAKTSILQDGTANTAPVGTDRVVRVETLHPVSHDLTVTAPSLVRPPGSAHSSCPDSDSQLSG